MTLSPLSMWNILNVTMSLCHHVIFFGQTDCKNDKKPLGVL